MYRILFLLLSISIVNAASFTPILTLSNGTTPAGVTPNPKYIIGSPYTIDGVEYIPSIDLKYRAEGIATVYGESKQGQLTANGEIFDSLQISASHPTLPLPSFVELRSLDNNRSIVVRVNDRGPYSNDGAIIGVSKRVFELIGLKDAQTARVEIRILAEDSKLVAEEYGLQIEKMAGSSSNEIYSCPTLVDSIDICRGIFIQVGAFTNEKGAINFLNDIKPYSRKNMAFILKGTETIPINRVRIGPFISLQSARDALQEIPLSYGAKIVIEE